tara:strand:- start:151 stop:390 length:240 start_codon:yes stop_codon:yes gene_type:complete
MAFKMRSNPMQRNFGSALKDFPKGAGVHGHEGKDGNITYHGKSRTTGKKSTYEVTKGDDGVDVLKKNPTSTFGTNKFDE